MTNTVKSTTGSATFGKTTGGYQTSVPELRKYEKALLKFLTVGERLAHTKYLLHKAMPKNMGDTINLRRYFDIEKDPRNLKFDKNTINGPEIKELHGAAVEFKLEWFGNGVSFNDVATEIHLDNLMQIAMPILMANARIVMDNIAGLALYEGASKAFIKAYDATKDESVTLGAAASDVAGKLNHDILRYIAKEMINNKETYTLADGSTTVTLRAKINPIAGGKYNVLLSEDGMDDLLDDPKFLEKFIKGITAQELRDNKIVSTYRYQLEVIDNFLTVAKTDGAVKLEGEGDLQVAFMFGDEFAADVKLEGNGVQMFSKLPNTADSGDVYGRYAFATYKLAYNAQVINSKAIYAVVYKPGSYVATGSIVAPTTSQPKQA